MTSYEQAAAALAEQQVEKQAAIRERVARSRAILAGAKGRARTTEEEAELTRLDGEMTGLEEELRAMPASVAIKLDPGDGMETTEKAATRDHATGSRWLDLKSGREIRALAPSERLVDEMALTPEDRKLNLGRYLRGTVTGNWQGAEAEQRAALTVGSLSGGGALVPAPLSGQLWDLARAQSVVMRMGAQTIPMTSTTLDIARVVGDPTASWQGGDEVRVSGVPESSSSFGRAQLQSQTMAIIERASLELAEDAPNFEQLIQNQIAKAAGLELDRAVLYGIASSGHDGLRGWLTGDATNSINEIDMGTNGAAITDYSKFVSAVQKVLEGNYPGEINQLGLVMAPRTWGTIEGFKEATTNAPLRGPASWDALRKLVSTQCPITETQGNVATASSVFVGDFSQVLVGMRTEIVLEASRDAYDAFTRLHVLIRGYLRADWQVIQPKWLTRVVGIIP